VVACGVRPNVQLARQAGPEHDGQLYGLVAPAWEQAAVAAARITGADPDARYAGSALVTRLKAAGVELAAMGDTRPEDGDDGDWGGGDGDGGGATEVVQVADPARGRYQKLVVRDGRLAGAILLGDVSAAGLVTQLFDRGAPVPPDRLGLLVGGRSGTGGGTADGVDPATLPDQATVCHCNQVSKGTVAACVQDGARSVAEVAAATRATTGCGTCADTVGALLRPVSAPDGQPAPTS
jgi:assimilatory nitrate reductase electron transfer subunit